MKRPSAARRNGSLGHGLVTRAGCDLPVTDVIDAVKARVVRWAGVRGDGRCEVTTTGTTSAAAADGPPRYPEPLGTAIALAVSWTFVATVALLTAGGIVSALLDTGKRPHPDL
jgi:hypothetical protein